MGNARQRKLNNPNYGLPEIKTKISPLTGKALIVLCARSHEMVISAHLSQETLELGMAQCDRCISSFSKEQWQDFDNTFQAFMQKLIHSGEYDYPDEDEVIGVLQNGVIDTSRDRRLAAMAESNIESIKKTGEKLFSGSVTSF